MRSLTFSLALLVALTAGTGAGEAREAGPSAAPVACGTLPGTRSRIAYARLLGTTVIRRAHSDLHT